MLRFSFDGNNQGGEFKLFDGDTEIGEVTFRAAHAGTISINHTYVRPIHEGKGYGKKLVEKVMEYAEENNLQLEASCWFAVKIIELHKK